MESENEIENIITPILDGMGLSLVEVSIGRHRGDIKVNLVLYKKDGISLDDLTKAQKTLRPRLELVYDRDNLSLEISSPGLARNIKHPREYGVFSGRKVKLLLDENWIEGTLNGFNNGLILVEIDNEILEIPVERVRKAKLD
jgi:ribosome maturation factor RimP